MVRLLAATPNVQELALVWRIAPVSSKVPINLFASPPHLCILRVSTRQSDRIGIEGLLRLFGNLPKTSRLCHLTTGLHWSDVMSLVDIVGWCLETLEVGAPLGFLLPSIQMPSTADWLGLLVKAPKLLSLFVATPISMQVLQDLPVAVLPEGKDILLAIHPNVFAYARVEGLLQDPMMDDVPPEHLPFVLQALMQLQLGDADAIL